MARHEITFKRVVYEAPGMREVAVRRDIEYARTDAGPLTLDLYAPPDAAPNKPLPAVVLVGGYPDAGTTLALGCTSKEMEMVISWAQLIATTGLAAISYTKQDPVRDVGRLLEFIQANGDGLGVDATRIGVWAASGNVPVALSLLMPEAPLAIRCAVLCYGYTLDAPGITAVADASATWHFANPMAGRRVAELKRDVPVFVARAGADTFPNLNTALDRFVCEALDHNIPLTVVNAATAPHAFDLLEATDESRHIVELILQFQRYQLSPRGL